MAEETRREALENALTQMQDQVGEPAADEDIEAAAPEPTEPADAAGEGEDGQGSDDAPTASEPAATEASDADTSQGITAPQTWPHERQEAFDGLTDEGKEILLGIHKDMEAGLTKSQTDLADQRKRFQKMDSFFDGMAQRYPQAGRETVESAVMEALPNLMNTYVELQQKPVDTLIELAEMYGATDALSEQLMALDTDEQSRALRRENAQLRRNQSTQEFNQNTRVSSDAQTAIDAFADAKTDDGVPLHPYFDEVRSSMSVLMGSDPELSLQDAYDKALRMEKPDVAREQMEAEIRAKLKQETRGQIKQARKVPGSPHGRSGPGVPVTKDADTPQSRREHLALEYAKQLAE